MQTFLIKTRAITGKYVPFRAEHVEYDELSRAIIDAKVCVDVSGESLVIVDAATDAIVAYVE